MVKLVKSSRQESVLFCVATSGRIPTFSCKAGSYLSSSGFRKSKAMMLSSPLLRDS